MTSCPVCSFPPIRRTVWNSQDRRYEYHYQCACGGSYVTVETLLKGSWPATSPKEPAKNV